MRRRACAPPCARALTVLEIALLVLAHVLIVCASPAPPRSASSHSHASSSSSAPASSSSPASSSDPASASLAAELSPLLTPAAWERLFRELDDYDAAHARMDAAELKLDPSLRLVATAPRLGAYHPPQALARAQRRVREAILDATQQPRTFERRRQQQESDDVIPVAVHTRPGQRGPVTAAIAAAAPGAYIVEEALLDGAVRVDATMPDILAIARLGSVTYVVLADTLALGAGVASLDLDDGEGDNVVVTEDVAEEGAEDEEVGGEEEGDAGAPRRRTTHAQSATTAAIAAAQTAMAASLNLDGTGVTICLVSDSLSGLSSAQALGVVPPNVTTLVPPGSTSTPQNADIYRSIPVAGEAIAMLEVLYAIAPNASYLFASGLGGQAVMAQAILTLMNAGCSVIVDDLLYVGEPGHWDGPIAVAVDRAVASGIVYVTAAGNNYNVAGGPGAWEGSASFSQISGRFQMAFGVDATNKTVTLNTLTRDPPWAVTLRWADNPTGPVANYDLLLLDPTGAILQLSDRGLAEPLEFIDSPPGFNDLGNLIMVISRSTSGPFPTALVNSHGGQLAYGTSGSINGHSAARGAITVGAVAPAGAGCTPANPRAAECTPAVRAYSADGVRTLFYSQFGVALASSVNSLTSWGTEVRQVPTVMAIDSYATVTFGNFTGTSAAAAIAAAQLALIRQAAPALTPASIAAIATGTAFSGPAGGWTSLRGYGTLNLDGILANITSTREKKRGVRC